MNEHITKVQRALDISKQINEAHVTHTAALDNHMFGLAEQIEERTADLIAEMKSITDEWK